MAEIKSNFFKKWVLTAAGIIIAVILAPITVKIIETLGFSFYSRYGLDMLLDNYFGDMNFNDILSDDLMIASYSFNAKAPRFFNKRWYNIFPGIYKQPLKVAVGASSSAPTYFDPLEI